ncbi:MAG TPA: anti-sigma factor, partial [Thermoanaerobaculia bacterium]|nr:anti-sigma factor [Thermoanaerobaculia bacterium]
MSNEEASSEDRTILAAVESLEQGTAAFRAPSGDEAAETLARLYSEVLGLVPFGLEPVSPAPEIRNRLLASIHGDETQPAASLAPTAVPTRSSPEVRPPRMAPAPPLAARRPAPRRWPLALAATLCFALLGLSAWLYLQMGQQRQTIARLQDELIAERNRAEEASEEARKVRASVQGLREKFGLVTSPAVLVSPMRPAGEAPLQPGARGVLFVAADHQHWYLSLEGLQPAETGKTYKLWFVADQGTVSAGSFTARPGEPVELSSKTMPAGTREALVTLENDPNAPAPTGPAVLRSAAP